jgi:hypothetical protein
MGSPAPVTAAPRFNVNAIVAQVIEALRRQSQTTPLPPDIPVNLLATLEILGQGPGPGRPLGAAGNAVIGAWRQAAAAEQLVTILRGNGQVALAGTAVPVAPAIAITDGFGRPSQGVAIRSAVTAGDGTIVAGSPSTGQDGVASLIAWTLGPTPGLNQLQFSFPGLPGAPTVDFVAVAVPTRRCEILRGDGQHETHGTALPIDPAVRVADARTGQPLADLNVTFTATVGGNVNAAAVTNEDGIATPGQWTLGSKGTNTLVGAVEGADPAVFTAEAT